MHYSFNRLFCWINICIIVQWCSYVNGQCTVETLPLVLNSSNVLQYLSSPNYPSNYDSNSDCAWRITAPTSDEKVVINVETLNLEGSGTCRYDSLSIYDGADNEGTLVGKLCTTNKDDVNEYVSTGNSLYFVLASDYALQYSGFNILYFTPNSESQPGCGTAFNAIETPQTIMSTNLPAAANTEVNCSYSFTSNLNITKFNLKFLDLDGATSCGTSYLAFHDGADATGNALSVQCTEAVVYEFTEIETTGQTAFVQWIRNNTATSAYGFVLTYESANATIITTTVPTTIGTSTTDSTCSSAGQSLTAYTWTNLIASPNFGTSNYDNNQECKWIITATTNYVVEVQFGDDFSIEYNSVCNYDSVGLYNGDTTSSSALINSFCGTSVTSNAYKSSGRIMTVYFTTDFSITKTGFQLQYKAADNTYPTCKSAYTEYDATYNIGTSAGSPYNTIETTSYGTTNYANNLDTFWLFTNSQFGKYTMVLEITGIEIERANGCIYDKLTVYNGPCASNDVLDYVCGTWKKRWDLSDSEYLVHFHSDGSVTRDGFRMEYYVIDPQTTAPPTTTTTTNGPPVAAVVEAINEALANYSNEVLPSRDLSKPITVSVDFYLVGINGVDEVEQKLTTTAQFVVTWTDAYLSWLPSKRSNIVRLLLPQDDLWKPDIALMNGFATISAMGATFMYIDVDYNGSCIWRPYQIMESICQIDMTYYPYDTQTCILQFGTWASSDAEVITQLGANGLQIHENFQENAEWILKSYRTIIETENSQNTVKFYLILERNPSYITFYMTVPTAMLAYLNVFTFLIPCESGEKSGFSVTVFLSFVVVLIVVNDSMPENSETLSLYSIYILTMTMVSTLSLMVSILQLRALTFSTFRYPIGPKLKRFVLFAKMITDKITCLVAGREKTTEVKDIASSNGNKTEIDVLTDTASVSSEQISVTSSNNTNINAGNVEMDTDTLLGDDINEKTPLAENSIDSYKSVKDNEGKTVSVNNNEKGKRVKFKDEDTENELQDKNVEHVERNDMSLQREVTTASIMFERENTTAGNEKMNTPQRSNSVMSNRAQSVVPPFSSFTRPKSVQGFVQEPESHPFFVEENKIISFPNRPTSAPRKRPLYGINRREQSDLNSAFPFNRCPSVMEDDVGNVSYNEAGEDEQNDNDNKSVASENSNNCEENSDDGITWTDVVNVSDSIFFLLCFALTTILTISFFVPMATNNG